MPASSDGTDRTRDQARPVCSIRRVAGRHCTTPVANAVKYGSPGTDVHVDMTGDADCVRVTGCNVGEPLSVNALDAMFDPLRRGAKRASTDERMSLGLGLFLVREIARAHGGDVVASSADGVTRFSISLPRNA